MIFVLYLEFPPRTGQFVPVVNLRISWDDWISGHLAWQLGQAEPSMVPFACRRGGSSRQLLVGCLNLLAFHKNCLILPQIWTTKRTEEQSESNIIYEFFGMCHTRNRILFVRCMPLPPPPPLKHGDRWTLNNLIYMFNISLYTIIK